MSDNLPHVSYELDPPNSIVRIESEIRSNIRQFSSIEETLRRLDTNLNPERQISESSNESYEDQAERFISDEDLPPIYLVGTFIDDAQLSDVTDGASSPASNAEINTSTVNLEDNNRYCWVCFATDEDDATASWVKPCRCRGTAKWVHQGCLQKWVDEKQKGRADVDVACPQCNKEYIIVYPHMGPVLIVFDTIDRIIYGISPFIAASIVSLSIYWTAVTYGAVTVIQVVGLNDGLVMMEQADPMVLLVGLPTIPILLVLGKMLRWEDQALYLLRRHACKLPILKHFLPSSDDRSQSEEVTSMIDPVSATRILCGALLLPSIASICGKLFFESIHSNFKKTLFGGIAFITIKGAFKIYHKQQQYVRQCQRQILDYSDDKASQTN